MFRFLIVDDSRVMRRMLQNTLKSSGYEASEFIEAVDGRDALDKLEKFKFDLMITDIMMPRMDGISLLLESRKTYPKMPVLIITGYAKELSVSKARQLGAFDLLIKPFKNNEIIYKVNR